jgi:alpha-D-ribose 1-methylphosphonate 5-triphosphate diphosphatase
MLAHDTQTAAAGVTTVLDALCLGRPRLRHRPHPDLRGRACATSTRWPGTGLLKSDHFLHLRCELPAADMPELWTSVADHPLGADGQPDGPLAGRRPVPRPRALPKMRVASSRLTPAQVDARIAELLDPAGEAARTRSAAGCSTASPTATCPLASHDDATPAEVEANAADGITISEFPVSLEAARRRSASASR